MSHEITDAMVNHPISTGIVTATTAIPVVNWMDIASSTVTLMAGCVGIAVGYFVIQNHRANIKLSEYKLRKLKEENE